jgi:hypothetical protein
MMRHSGWTALAWLGAGLALVGIWGAWVPHRAAALVLSGWDMAEFAKFLPGVSAIRELFYLPAWCLGLALALLAHRPGAGLIRRVGLSALALALMVAVLPPYPQLLQGVGPAESRWQFALGASGLVLVPLAGFSRRWPAPAVGGLLLALAVAGAVPPLWQFLQLRGVIASVYAARLGWGWGLVAFLLGWGLLGVVGARLAFADTRHEVG